MVSVETYLWLLSCFCFYVKNRISFCQEGKNTSAILLERIKIAINTLQYFSFLKKNADVHEDEIF